MRLRATGMPIRDMRRFAQLRRGGPGTVAARRELLDSHRRRVLDGIEQLQRDLRAIDAKLTRLESGVDLEEGAG
jgi:DNA-binding transcriptional MerR regulator